MRHKTNNIIAIGCTLTLALLLLALASQSYLKNLQQQALAESLQAVLNTTQQALHTWAGEQQRAAQIQAGDAELQRLTAALLGRQTAAQAADTASLRRHLQRPFFITDTRHRVIASSNKALEGGASLLSGESEQVRSVWRGETHLAIALHTGFTSSEQTAPSPAAKAVRQRPGVLVNTPIRGTAGDIIALLSLEVGPQQFGSIISHGRIGSSGETYAFNRAGVLLSESRFNRQLREAGLLQPQQSSALNIVLRNPGTGSRRRGEPDAQRQYLPLTTMVASATRGGSGVNTEGYRNYLGKKVIGAWLWDDTLNFGLATEIGIDEALRPYTHSRNLMFITVFLIGLVLGTLLWLQIRNQHKYQNLSHQLESILSNTTSLIYIKDRDDQLLLANRAFREATGQGETALPDKRVQQLLASGDTSRGDYYDQLVLQEKRPVEYEQTLALQNRRRVFLTVKFPMSDQQGHTYAIGAVSTDITSRREMETALQERERFLDSMMANLPGMAYRRRGDDSYTTIYLSHGCMALTAYPARCFVNREVNFLDIVHEDDRHLITTNIEACLKQHRSFEVEYRIRTASGAEKWVWERGRGIYDHRDNIVFIEGFVTDISDRKQMDKELAAHRQHLAGLVEERTQQLDYERIRLNALIDNAADGIINVDGNGLVTLFSPAAEKIFGYSAAEVLGKNVTLLIPDDQQPAHLRGMARIRDNPREPVASRTLELKAVHKRGHSFPIELSLSQATVDRDVIFTGIVRDITERLEYQKTLEATTAMAEEASRTKSEFLANMSHEIRTPMNAIIGMTQLALQTDLSEKQKRFLTAVNTASNNLMGVINDILDFSKIEAGKLHIENIPFNLNEVMDTVAHMAAPRAQEKGLEFVFDIAIDVPLSLCGDPLRLNQIFTNLCSNAVKFTDSGEIVLQARRLSGDNDNDNGNNNNGNNNAHNDDHKNDDNKVTLQFSVIDTGIGISRDSQRHLFQAFSQADATITRNYGGTGLGLSICKKLVTLMDGSIEVHSEEGKGSSFTFVLSLDLDPQHISGHRRPGAQLAGSAVLVAEDHPVSQTVLLSLLSEAGASAEAVNSGETLLHKLRSAARPVDILLLDGKLGGRESCDLMRQVRANPSLQQPPVVLMTTHYNHEEFGDIAARLGIKHIITKPFNNSVFFSQLESALQPQKKNPELGHGDPHGVTEAGSNFRKRILVVEDNDINQTVAGEILQGLGYEVDIAGNGREAIDKVARQRFDAVLMDVQMPVMGGYAATRAIRKMPHAKSLPIIAMTANAMASDKDKCLVAGMNGFLSKPINLEKLAAALRHWLWPDGAAKDAGPNAALAAAVKELDLPRQLPGLNIELGLINCSYNKAFYLKLLTKFTGDYAPRLDNIRELINDDKRQDAIHIVHTVKGVSGNLGATGLYASARKLESALRGGGDAAGLAGHFEQIDSCMQQLIGNVKHLAQAVHPADQSPGDGGGAMRRKAGRA